MTESKRTVFEFGIHVLNGTLIAPVQGEIDEDSAKRFQRAVLDHVQTASISGVLIDMSAVRVIDSSIFAILADTARMVSLQGSKPVFVGFQPGVASALIDLNIDLDRIFTALTMEDGLEWLRSAMPPWKRTAQPEDDDAGDGETDDDEDGGEEPSEGNEDDHDRGP